MINSNPFQVEIREITIERFNSTEKMSIMPQFVELNLYQNVFSPFMRAEMTVYDPIGLFVNYPLVGEEIITVSYNQTGTGKSIKNDSLGSIFPFGVPPKTSNAARTLKFMITSIVDISPTNQARAYTYVLNLASLEAFYSTKTQISHAYVGPTHKAAQELFNKYIYDPARISHSIFKEFFIDTEERDEATAIDDEYVVPNKNGVQSLKLMTKRAVAKNPGKYASWVFFENLYGYFFTTIQSLIEDQMNYSSELELEKYIYMSNSENNKYISNASDFRLISNIYFNKRFSSVEKMIGGYYSSEFIEINPTQKDYNSTRLNENETANDGYLYPNKMNTKNYLDTASEGFYKRDVEDTPHLKYEVVLFVDENSEQRRFKYNQNIKYMQSLNQVDVHITIPGDMSHNCGELIYAEIPEMHGFENIEADKYITGLFFVSEIKHTIGVAGHAATTMRLHKDSYAAPLETKHKYKINIRSETEYVDTSEGQE
jgi:hypothetical protein